MARTLINPLGTKHYINDKHRSHRIDGPAIIYKDGGEEWWANGRLHRGNGPAMTNADGEVVFCVRGKMHRADSPAISSPNGLKEWWFGDDQIWPEL